MKWEIFHRTRYLYASPVRESFNEVRLQPVSNKEQTVESFLLKVLPAARLRHYLDFYSNSIHHFELPEPHSTLMVESQAVVRTHRAPPLALEARPAPLSELPAAARSERCFDYLLASRFVDLSPETWRLAMDATEGHTDVWQAALSIMRFLYRGLKYEPESTHVHTHMSEVIEQRRGVCQDFAHVMLGMCRSIHLPALYVSGYLATETTSATHAWVEVFVPGLGWQALDPTHNRPVDETYVKLAVGRDYADVPPISGHYKGTTDRRMEVEVSISAVD